VLSWVLLRGRCRDCREPISIRYPLVELATGLTFAVTAAFVGWSVLLPFALWFTAACIALTLIDLDHKRLPNVLTLSTYAVVLVGLALAAAIEGEWSQFGRAVLGGLALAAFYALLALLVPAGMGWGDAKLALALGTVLGWFGWWAVLVGGFGAFVLGAVTGLLAIAAGTAGRRSALPFGPFMILAVFLALAMGQGVADWYTGLLQ
jgi:leader peptidase (prepilin peptidase)/N-methyltransferase